MIDFLASPAVVAIVSVAFLVTLGAFLLVLVQFIIALVRLKQ